MLMHSDIMADDAKSIGREVHPIMVFTFIL